MLSRLRRRLSGGARAVAGRAAPALDFKALHLPRMRLSDLHAPEIDWSRLGSRFNREGPRPGALWPTVFAVAGAGAAFLWWNQWARGQAEADDHARREADAAAEGAAHPEAIMAHAPPPADAPAHDEAAGSDRVVDAIMAHAPAPDMTAEPQPARKPRVSKAGPVVSASVAEGLDASLAVQAAQTPSTKDAGEA